MLSREIPYFLRYVSRMLSRAYEGTSHRFDDTRLIGADNLYAALIRRYFQVALRRRSYAERARDGVRRVECNLTGNPWQCACVHRICAHSS